MVVGPEKWPHYLTNCPPCTYENLALKKAHFWWLGELPFVNNSLYLWKSTCDMNLWLTIVELIMNDLMSLINI